MFPAGAIVVLTEDGAKEVMTRWSESHPFHRLAKFLTEHSDAQILIKKHSYGKHYDVTVTPETYVKYKEEIKKEKLGVHLGNWEEDWFRVVGQTPLPEPEYRVGEQVFIKNDEGKYEKTTIEKIEPIWTSWIDSEACKFKTWGYRVIGTYYPIRENQITPTFQHEKLKPPTNTEENGEALLKRYGWTKLFDENWQKWCLKSNRGFDKFFDHEPTFEEIKETVEPIKQEEQPLTKFAEGQKVSYQGKTYTIKGMQHPSDGWYYLLETFPVKWVHEDQLNETVGEESIVTEEFEVEPPEPMKVSEEIPVGVPEGFYNNESLINMNKGSLPPNLKDKVPTTLPCWGCDKPLRVCGFPFYICDNNHAYNVKTKEKWFWKGYDDVYHGLLNVLQGHVEPTYQKLFHPQSRAREHTEARISTQLAQIGKILYDKLNVQEDDKYHWGKDNFRHFAGLRFAINLMSQAILTRIKIKFPSDTIPAENVEGWQKEGLQKLYEYDADEYLKVLRREHVKEMLLSIEKAKAEMPKQTVQKTLF